MSIFELQYKFLTDEVHAMSKYAKENEETMGRDKALDYWILNIFEDWKKDWCEKHRIKFEDLMK